MSDVRQDVGKLVGAVVDAPFHTASTHPEHLTQPDHKPCFHLEGEIPQTLTRLGAHLLLTREGIEVYAASYREFIGPPKGAGPSTSHEIYTINNGVKVPAKVKPVRGGRSIHPDVLVVDYSALIKEVDQDTIQELYYRAQRSGEAIAKRQLMELSVVWLGQEAMGQTLAPERVRFIDVLAANLRQKIEAHGERLLERRETASQPEA